MASWWRGIAPIAVALIVTLMPTPPGLPHYAWYYFAIFAGVIVGLITEPLPGGAVGLVGVITAAGIRPIRAVQSGRPGATRF
jgi:L-tartrate/succinate antiporter